jgi:hypothetical protein
VTSSITDRKALIGLPLLAYRIQNVLGKLIPIVSNTSSIVKTIWRDS